MTQSELEVVILSEAIAWADHVEAADGLDERLLQSTVLNRTAAADCLQNIRRLVKELRNGS